MGRRPCTCCEPCKEVRYSEDEPTIDADKDDFSAVGTLTVALANRSPTGITWEGTIEPNEVVAKESYLLYLELWGDFELEVESVRIVIDTTTGTLEVGPSGSSTTRYFDVDDTYDRPCILKVYVTPDYILVGAYQREYAPVDADFKQTSAVIALTQSMGSTGAWEITCNDATNHYLVGGWMESRQVTYGNGTYSPPTVDCSDTLTFPCPKVYYDEIHDRTVVPHEPQPDVTVTGPGVYIAPSASAEEAFPGLLYESDSLLIRDCGFFVTQTSFWYQDPGVAAPTAKGFVISTGDVTFTLPAHSGSTPYPTAYWFALFSFTYQYIWIVSGLFDCQFIQSSSSNSASENIDINDIDAGTTLSVTNTVDTFVSSFPSNSPPDCSEQAGFPSSNSPFSADWDIF